MAYLDGVHPSVVMTRGYYTYVYAAAYDENGVLVKMNCVPLEMSGNTTISIDKTDKVESAKVFVLSDMLQPVIQAQEFNIE